MVLLLKTRVRDNPTFKAGHPPAVKAGGKRVVKKSSDENLSVDKDVKRRTDKSRSLVTLPKTQSASALLAGSVGKLGHEFPGTPVSVRHSGLRPAVEKLHSPRVVLIQQPRKC